MNLLTVHAGLARTATYFLAVLAIWAIYLRVRKQPLDGNWYGAAVIGELLLIGQFLLGWLLYFQFGGGVLSRPLLHILYGFVAVITLPAGYSYFGRIEDEGVQTIAMAVLCIFLWGIIQRSGTGANFSPF